MVTGIGAITPLADSAPATWAGLVAGRSGISPIESFDASGLPTRIAGEIHGFDAEAALGPKRARRAARFSQLAIVAAREAVADAGLDLTAAPDRTAVIVNSACAGTPETERNIRTLVAKGPKDVSPYYVASTILNMAACEVAIDLKTHGPVNASRTGVRERDGSAARGPAADRLGRGRCRHRRRHRRGHQRGDVRRAVGDGPSVGTKRRPRRRPAARSTPTATASCSARAP